MKLTHNKDHKKFTIQVFLYKYIYKAFKNLEEEEVFLKNNDFKIFLIVY